MKRIMLCLISLFCLSACVNEPKNNTNDSNIENTMYIKPTEFSEETKKVLSLFNNEIAFFDMSIDETVKTFSMSLWLYKDGEWEKSDLMYGNTEEDYLPNRWAIRLIENKLDLYSISDDGHVKYGRDLVYPEIEGNIGKVRYSLSKKQTIDLNKETILYALIGSKDSKMKVYDGIDAIDEIECDAGIVITMNFSDQLSE